MCYNKLELRSIVGVKKKGGSMDNRTFSRTECDIPVSADISGKEIWCNVRNISVGGALLEVHKGHSKKISRRHIGNPASFFLYSDLPSIINYRGKIVRYREKEGKKYVAVQFFDLLSNRVNDEFRPTVSI